MNQMQRFLEALHSDWISPGELIAALALLMGLALLFVLRSRWQAREAGIITGKRAQRDFSDWCLGRGLDREEIKLLRHGVMTFGETPAPGVVQSNCLFDRLAQRMISVAYAEEIPRLNSAIGKIREKLGFRPPGRGLALSSTRELCPGQMLYLVQDDRLFLEAFVTEVDETKLIAELMPQNGHAWPLGANQSVRLHFNRAGDARYSGSCHILKSQADTEGIFLTLCHCEELKRDQRRQEFRVDQGRQVLIWVVNEFWDDPVQARSLQRKFATEEALLEDLSGGGASVILGRALPVNQKLYVNLDGPAGLGLPLLRAIVIRSVRRSGPENWAISAHFMDVSWADRQKLVRHVFSQEREAIRAM